MLTIRNYSYILQSRTVPNKKEVMFLEKRNTPQKRIVMRTLAEMKNHPSASMVYETVHQSHPTISKSTVFRILGNAAEEGDVKRLHITGSDDRFDHQCHRHYHIVCQNCGSVEDVSIPYLKEIDKQVSEIYEYQSVEHDIEFRGICTQCQGKDTENTEDKE